MAVSELDQLRHDLKNVLSALHHGCLLVRRGLPANADPELREFLGDMQDRIDHGFDLLDRLRDPDEVLPPASGGPQS